MGLGAVIRGAVIRAAIQAIRNVRRLFGHGLAGDLRLRVCAVYGSIEHVACRGFGPPFPKARRLRGWTSITTARQPPSQEPWLGVKITAVHGR